jgi:Protein of unknown function (DUF3866)
MATFREGKVVEIVETRSDLVTLRVDVDGERLNAAAFPDMVGPLETNHRVVLNTTGIDLGLGTGGVAFVLWNLDGPAPEPDLEGHIVKMRYTPWQKNVMAVEAPESPHQEKLRGRESMDVASVVACSLHSQIAGVAAGVKAQFPGATVGYLMTDGAALPLAWSRLVRQLKDAGLIDVTATCGHAFGGDIEAVNVFSGMAALDVVGGARVIIASMGPGGVGTGTTLGHSAMEQGQLINAAVAMRGAGAVACLRISFADERERHHGISHHTLSALEIAARERCTIAVPELPTVQMSRVMDDLKRLDGLHDIEVIDGGPGVALLKEKGIRPTSMGRSLDEVPELFLAGAAAGRVAAFKAVPHVFEKE